MANYWWNKYHPIKQISIAPADFPFKPGSPAALAQEAIVELDAEWNEVQALYTERKSELERLQDIGTEPVIASWNDDPTTVMVATPAQTEIDAHAAVVKKLLERRTELERARQRQRGVIAHAFDEMVRAVSAYNYGAGEYAQHLQAARHDQTKDISCVYCCELLAIVAVRGELIKKVYKALSGKSYDRRRYGELFDG